jgi:hypothetical protein
MFLKDFEEISRSGHKHFNRVYWKSRKSVNLQSDDIKKIREESVS